MRTLPAGPRRLRPSAAAARMLLVLLYLCPMAAAQPQFADVPMQHLPANADFTHSITAADVDGDGDADLILGNRGAQNRLYLSEGDSTFSDVTTTRLPADTDLTTAIATGDVDGDGDLDVVVGNAAANRLYLNDGTGVFTDASAARLPADNDETLAVAFVDVDGDGDLDLVLGTSRGQDRLYINDGDGTFVDETAARLPTDTSSTFALGAADIDGDGDADLIVGKPWGVQDLLYENDGQGVFTDRTAGQLPPQNRGTTGIALGDIDADGDLDVVIGCNGWNTLVFVNDGGGIFADDSAARISLDPDFTRGLLLQDLDGDGDLDLALANTTQQNRLYLNDGAGVFADVTAARFPVDDTSSLAVTAGDVDGDGDPDLAFANNGQRDAIYVNVGAGSFANGESQRLPRQGAETLAAATADVNGDGAADLIFAGVSGTALHLNDGRGAFVDVSGSAFTPRRFDDTSDIAVGDLDGDGDQDLVLANGYITSRVFLNDGSGQFTEIQALPRRTNAAAVALGDVDGDGDLDVFFGDGRLYFNNSEARFFGGGPSRIPSLPSAILDAVMHDVDADGDLDLVLANDRTQNYLYLNDGTGTFRDATEERMPVDADRTFALAVADVDGDGAPDLALANLGTQNRLYLNDGAGRFTDVTAAQLPIDTDASNSVTAADVDLDGAVDLIWGNLREQNRFYANDGTGAFTDQTATRLASAMLLTQDVLLVDVDGDSDPDLITADYQTSNRLELNLAGQLDTPLLALLGRRYQLDFYSRFAGPQRFDTAVPLLAAAPARIALPPFGILGLDPPGLVALPPVAVPAGTGVGTLSFLLPNVPAAAGQTLYAQAVLVAGSGRAVLTNVTADTLLP